MALSPLSAPDESEEQSEAERLRIARRYRERRGAELRALAAPHAGGEVVAAGEFSSTPIETLAAIPVFGALFAAAVRVGASRRRITPNVLVALDAERVHLLSLRTETTGPTAEPLESWPRSAVRVASVQPRFMREEVRFEIEGSEALKLYARSLRTNPWAGEVVRLLGGEAPAPIDLGDPDLGDPELD